MAAPRVRPFAAGDAAAVAALEALCNPLPWSAADVAPFADPAPSSFVRLGLVAEETGGRILGYVFASCVAGEAEILILGVAPDARRKGHARALLEDLFARLKILEAVSVFLEVRAGNMSAIRLYENMGFTGLGVRKGYYADTGEDARLLRRDM